MKKKPVTHAGFIYVAFLFAFLLSVVFHTLYEKPPGNTVLKKQAEALIQKREQQLDEAIEFVKLNLDGQKTRKLWYSTEPTQEFLKNHIHLFLTNGDSILYWNSNLVSGSEIINKELSDTALRRFDNVWCIEKTVEHNGLYIRAYYAIKYVYRINNDLIKSHFTELNLPASTRVSSTQSDDFIAINDANGRFLFSLDLREPIPGSPLYRYLAIFFINLTLLLLIAWFYQRISRSVLKRTRIRYFIGMGLVMAAFIQLMQHFRFPAIITELEIFSPTNLAIPGLFHSLGILVYVSVFWLIWTFTFYRYGNFNVKGLSEITRYLLGLALLVVFVLFTWLFMMAIDYSVINFEIYRLLEADIYSFIVYIAFFALFGGWMLLAVWGIQKAEIENLKSFYLLLLGAGLLIGILAFTFDKKALLYAAITATAYIALIGFVTRRSNSKFNYLHFFLYSFLLSVLLVQIVWSYGHRLEYQKQKTTLVNVSEGLFSERDRFSEILMERLWARLENDNRLKYLVSGTQSDQSERIRSYLLDRYFTGYLNRFDVQTVVCWPGADLYVGLNGTPTGCYPYFEDMINDFCEQIGNTGFYYQNNKNGRVSYFAKVVFNEGQPREVSLFIDIESNPTSMGVGYPELLVDHASNNLMSHTYRYDFARYSEDQLITYTGTFRYNSDANWIPEFDSEFYRFEDNGYNHLVYRIDKDNFIVLSSEVLPWYDYLLFLTYVYLYLFIVVSLAMSVYLVAYKNSLFNRTLAGRIRFVMLGTLLIAFVLIGAASIFFNVKRVEDKQYESITEKSRNVMLFLDQYVGNVDNLKEMESEYLEGVLQNLSNGLEVDVNLYGNDGQLVSSSRPLIFDYNIVGRRMATEAYNTMHHFNSNMEVIEEGLGNFRYLSAYFMLYNWDNELLGYVNVPFFISKDELRAETSTFIVVIINIYLVFVLAAIFISILIIRKITRPLRMIQEKLSGLKVTGTNETIEYQEEDEIGDLVKEYNRMALALTRSANELASNQRKLAWREMARQIAHEIKNPLTPMKLNLQLLQRAKSENRDDFDKIFKRTANTMIEQIDNLSRIASEFSDFAKMPEARPSNVEIVRRLSGVVDLFRQSSEVDFEFYPDESLKVWVYADGEQLVQVFNNLVKNAIQAIPHNEKGKVEIDVQPSGKDVLVSIKDNGMGIDPEIQDRLFQPRFTTKSSGMGLGLAISRNIIVSAGGEIWFETVHKVGTTFFVKLPIIEEDE